MQMDIKHEFVKVLFDKEVRAKAVHMFRPDFECLGHKDRMPVDLYDISFRLHKPTQSCVNLEFLVSSPSGGYLQPVGFYERDDSIWVLNDLASQYNDLITLGNCREVQISLAKKRRH